MTEQGLTMKIIQQTSPAEPYLHSFCLNFESWDRLPEWAVNAVLQGTPWEMDQE